MYTSNDFPGYGKFCFPALNIVCVNRKIQSAARYSWFVLCMKSCSLKADCRHGVWIREKKKFLSCYASTEQYLQKYYHF